MAAQEIANKVNVGIRIDPKLHYQATIEARLRGIGLSGFVEMALRYALLPGVDIDEPEYPAPNDSRTILPLSARPLRHEGMWDVFEEMRFVMLATGYPQILNIEEQLRWKKVLAHCKSDAPNFTDAVAACKALKAAEAKSIKKGSK